VAAAADHRGDRADDVTRAVKTAKGCLYAAHGIYLLGAGLCLAVLSWLLPGWLAKIADSEVVDASKLPALARWVTTHRATMPLMALPVVLCGVVMLFRVRWRWVWLVAGSIALIVPAAILIFAFVAYMAGVYSGSAEL